MAERITTVNYQWKPEASVLGGDFDVLVSILNDHELYDSMVDEEDFDPRIWFYFRDEEEFNRAFDSENSEFDFVLFND